MTAGLTGCHRLDSNRIPPAPAWLVFNTIDQWYTYGIKGALDTQIYIKEQRLPSNYPYTATSLTGYGGVLLVGDIHGAPRAYDLACPVECKPDVRLVVDHDINKARCPRCGSIYDIFSNYGTPVQGPAREYEYALRQLYVGAGSQGQYMVIKDNDR